MYAGIFFKWMQKKLANKIVSKQGITPTCVGKRKIWSEITACFFQVAIFCFFPPNMS